MRLKKLSTNFNTKKDYDSEQKLVLSSIISRINRIGDFFDVVIKMEKFVIEEVRDEFAALVDIRNRKSEIEKAEGSVDYINKHFLPAVNKLNDKMEASVQSWNHVEREYTTGKIFGFISAMKNFSKELVAMDSALSDDEGEDDLHGSSTTVLIKDILDNFDKFKMYKAIMTDDVILKMQTLLSMQKDISDKEPEKKSNRVTLDDL